MAAIVQMQLKSFYILYSKTTNATIGSTRK